MLTRSGLGVAVVSVVLIVCGIWWRYEELVVVGVAALVAVLVALWSARAPHRARINRSVSAPRVARGDPVRAVYRAINPSTRRVTPVTLVDTCDEREVRIPLDAIGPNDRTEAVGLIPTRRRGVFPIGPWSVERIDPLGLAVGRRTGGEAGSIIVHPRVHPLKGPYGAMQTVEDDAVVRSAASDPLSGFVSLREYVEGDDPRMIHWPTSARMGTLMLREHVELRRPAFTVVVDAVDTVATPDDFEEMVDVAASIAVHALSTGIDVRVRTTAREYPGPTRPLERETLVLDVLTPIHQCTAERSMYLAEVFQGGMDHTMIVLVTGPYGPSTSLTASDKLTVVRIGLGAQPGPGVVVAASDAAEFVQKWRPWM